MFEHDRTSEEELSDLRREIEHFQKEKERVRSIVGQIGGMPQFSVKIMNVIFFIVILICFVVSILTQGHISILMIDIGLIALAVKLIILMHYISRVNHFQLWIMTSMEWRINEMNKHVKSVLKHLEKE